MTDQRCDHCQQTDLYCTCPEGLYRQEAFDLVERELHRLGITHVVIGRETGISVGDHDGAALMYRTLVGAVDAYASRKGACDGCGSARADCDRWQREQRKCCPDCTHRKEGGAG